MNSIYKKVLLTLFIFISYSSVQASTPKLSVRLSALSLNLNYQQPVRLSQVLTDSESWLHKENKNATFWLAAQLLQVNKNSQIIQLKENILATLAVLSAEYPKSKLKAEYLSTFINDSQFNYRYFISLDNDLVRITAKNNPLLEGKLKLLTPKRINKIRVVGSSEPSQTTELIAQASIDDYLKNISLPKNSNTSLVYIIQPDGAISKKNNAYWKKDAAFFAPGATLFIGFRSLPSKYARLNDQISELLRYITPLKEGDKK